VELVIIYTKNKQHKLAIPKDRNR